MKQNHIKQQYKPILWGKKILGDAGFLMFSFPS